MALTKTIAAISTPPGKGGVAIIRVSGDEAIAVAAKVFFPRSGKSLADLPSRVAVYGDVYSEGEAVDDGLLTLFRAPHSYTGEDTVEISCHGGTLITRTVLEALFAAGAEPAERGEFTRRAFLSGRLSLSEAEAIGTLIEAGSREQIKLSAAGARNKLKEAIGGVRVRILDLLSSIYARIDYPDEDLGDFSDAETVARITSLISDVEDLLSTYRTGRAINEGISTVICGKPNVGKSSLYNALIGEEAAIVTSEAGTTRDILERSAPFGKVMLHLYDTAGLHESGNTVEKIGISRAIERIREAELILAVFDGSSPLSEEDFETIREVKDSGAIAVCIINKSDLPQKTETAVLRGNFTEVVTLSAKEGGTNALKAVIERLFTDEKIVPGQDAIVSSARQFAALLRAKESLDGALSAYESGLATDAASSDLELALGAVSEIDGQSVHDAVVNDIFSKFCVGK